MACREARAYLLFAAYVAIAVADAALGQSKPPNLFEYATSPVPVSTRPLPSSDGWLPPGQRTMETVALTTVALPPKAPPAVMPERIVIVHGAGGSIYEHIGKFVGYRNAGAEVEIRGGCYSACTLITAYVGKDKLCIAPGAFMAFHAARTSMDGPIHGPMTITMVNLYPAEIRGWIDRNGGVDNLPRDGYWTMYDRDLWSFGYPKCK